MTDLLAAHNGAVVRMMVQYLKNVVRVRAILTPRGWSHLVICSRTPNFIHHVFAWMGLIASELFTNSNTLSGSRIAHCVRI
jgi:hypothetical protein